MPGPIKVIDCPIFELEDRMCELEGGWLPLAWNFYLDEGGNRCATVVLAKAQQPVIPMPPSNLFRPRG